jgi:hypothetical protein
MRLGVASKPRRFVGDSSEVSVAKRFPSDRGQDNKDTE